MPLPEVVQVVNANRAAIAAQEVQAIALMARQWIGVQDTLEQSILKLAQEAAAKVAAGEVVTASKLWEMQRYQALLAQTRQQVTRYAGVAANDIAKQQMAAGLLGQQHAGAAINASGVVGTFNRLEPNAIRDMIGLTGAGSPVRDLLIQTWPDAIDRITKALVNGTALGWNPRKTARAMTEGLDGALNRMMRIARTEQNRVYREATRERYQQSGVVTGYKRICAKQERTCLACLVLDGTFYELEDEFEDHVNGRCALVPCIRGRDAPEWPTGRDWFESQDEDAQRRIMGDKAFDLLAQGRITLDSLVKTTSDPVWGTSVSVRSVDAIQ